MVEIASAFSIKEGTSHTVSCSAMTRVVYRYMARPSPTCGHCVKKDNSFFKDTHQPVESNECHAPKREPAEEARRDVASGWTAMALPLDESDHPTCITIHLRRRSNTASQERLTSEYILHTHIRECPYGKQVHDFEPQNLAIPRIVPRAGLRGLVSCS
jgi:hypothetical protein